MAQARIDKERIKEELEKLADANDGVLRPEQVVEAARKQNHPLHALFEWNDKVAGEAHRLDQARSLIRSVKVKITTTTREIRASYFAHDPRLPKGEQGYIAAPRMRSEEDIARASIAAEFGRAVSALERARNQALACGLHDEAALADRLISELAVTRQAESSEAAA